MSNKSSDRLRLLADRLCYLAEGMDGLRRRHGMQRSYPGYSDEYDLRARVMIAGEEASGAGGAQTGRQRISGDV